MANCKYCGKKLNGENYCPGCGSPVTYDQQYPNQQYPNQPYNQYGQQAYNPNKTATGLPKDNNAIIGFACGLIGFLCCAIASIPGLICSILSQQDIKAGKVDPGNKTLSVVGMVFSIISLVLWVINIISITTSNSTSIANIVDLFSFFS